MTFRQPPTRVLIGDVHLTVVRAKDFGYSFSLTSDIEFTVIIDQNWPHNKTGVKGALQVNSSCKLRAGKRQYLKEEKTTGRLSLNQSRAEDVLIRKLSGQKWRKALPFKEIPSSLPVARLVSNDLAVTMSLGCPLDKNVNAARNVIQEVQTEVPPEMFDLSKFVCGTYVDSRMLILRGVDGSALLFTRACVNESCR